MDDGIYSDRKSSTCRLPRGGALTPPNLPTPPTKNMFTTRAEPAAHTSLQSECPSEGRGRGDENRAKHTPSSTPEIQRTPRTYLRG